ncbi:MAG TPA: ATP-binding cassette domain-containing protein, partial [Thermoanaerobaculia bacterium]|nr:ATP-binding cassette domain-containing protein [Thermoanaerobaculia bacterium]
MEPGTKGGRPGRRPRRGPPRRGRDPLRDAHRAPRQLLTLLELVAVSKSFGPTRALDRASLTVLGGEIHALLGENGAGKTTLVSVAAGLLRADEGRVRLRGRDVGFRTPRDARRGGIALVPQHDLLVEAATVAENLALLDASAPFLETPAARRRRVRRLADDFSLELGDPDTPAAALPVGTRQRIGIAGALAADPEILILDEPTAVLSPDETASLFASLRRRAASGKAVVLITHRLAEVFEAADRLTLLARGRTVKECPVAEATAEEIGSLLLGSAEGSEEERRSEDQRALPGGRRGLPALDVRELVPSGSPAPPVSFSLEGGDLLVLLAIDGNGADTLARCAAGMHPFSGRVEV